MTTKTLIQDRNQARVSGMAKLSWSNRVVQNLKAFFILYVTTIKWIIYVQVKIGVFSNSQRPRLSPIKISGDLSLAKKIEQQ